VAESKVSKIHYDPRLKPVTPRSRPGSPISIRRIATSKFNIRGTNVRVSATNDRSGFALTEVHRVSQNSQPVVSYPTDMGIARLASHLVRSRRYPDTGNEMRAVPYSLLRKVMSIPNAG